MVLDTEVANLFPDTDGIPNDDRPGDVYIYSPQACSSAAGGKKAVAIDLTVVGRPANLVRAPADRSPATKGDDEKRRDFNQRVTDINAVLSLQDAPPWVLEFEFMPFGIDTFGALGKEAQAVIPQIAENGQTDPRCLSASASASHWNI